MMNSTSLPQHAPQHEQPWPFIVRNGHGEVRVYRSESSRGYETYFVCWREGGVRKRVGISSPELAKQKARQIASQLSDGSGRLVKVPLIHLLQLESLVGKLNNRIPNY